MVREPSSTHARRLLALPSVPLTCTNVCAVDSGSLVSCRHRARARSAHTPLFTLNVRASAHDRRLVPPTIPQAVGTINTSPAGKKKKNNARPTQARTSWRDSSPRYVQQVDQRLLQ